MTSFEQTLFRWGIPTYIQTLTVDITTAATITVADTLPTQMGWIYGLNTYADGKDIDNTTLITAANAKLLYWKIVQGNTNFITNLRLSDILFDTTTQEGRYLEVNIPGTISIDQSQILNPTNIASGRLLLVLRYIDVKDLHSLVAKKAVLDGGFVRTIK